MDAANAYFNGATCHKLGDLSTLLRLLSWSSRFPPILSRIPPSCN